MAEIYSGVKFKTQFLSNEYLSDPRIYQLSSWAHYLAKHNMAPKYIGGSSGNLSFRINPNEKPFVITATATELESLWRLEDFVHVVECNFSSKELLVRGLKEPSSESMLHAAIYENRNDVNAIIHGHWPELLQNADKLKYPQTKTEQAYGSIELVNEVIAVLKEHSFILMKNHGFLALGKNIDEAGTILERVRESFTNVSTE